MHTEWRCGVLHRFMTILHKQHKSLVQALNDANDDVED